MKKFYIYLLPIFFTAVLGALCVSGTAYAAAAQTPTQDQLAVTKTTVLGKVGNPTDVSGLTKCSQTTLNTITNTQCGGVETADGTTAQGGSTYKAGDTVKCSFSLGEMYCAITTPSAVPGGTATTKYFDSGPLTSDTTTDNGSGQLTGSQGNYSPAGTSSGNDKNCALSSVLTSGGGTIGQCIVDAIGYPILAFSTFILGIAGVLFNLIVVKTIFGFGSLIGNAPGLLVAWGILRDISNMLILFGFIFVGITTVLNLQTYGARQAIPQLLIFAILMNFSLFAAEAVIDVSNGLSSTLYAQSNTSPCLNGGTTNLGNTTTNIASQQQLSANVNTIEGSCELNYGIAGSIMTATGISSLFSLDDSSTANTPLSVFLGLSLFAVITAVVLFAGSIMIAIRAITLTFVIILSPIGFAGMAIPPLRTAAGKWWNALIHQAFFAPIFLVLILVSLKVTESFAGSSGNKSLAAALSNPSVGLMGVILVFVLVIGFMVAALLAAHNFGAMGANFTVKTAGGAFGYLGRNTVGKQFNTLNDKIRSSSFGQTRVGRRVATFTDKGAKASFDFRGTKAGAVLGKQLGDLGKPAKDGYVGQIKRETEEYTKYAGTLKQTAEAKEREKQLNKKKEIISKSKEIENTRWEQEKTTLQSAVNAEKTSSQQAQTAHAQELSAQEAKLSAAIASRNKVDENRERRRLEEMTAHRNELSAETQAKIQAAEGTLKAAEQQHKDFIGQFDQEVKNVDTEIKGDIDKGIAGVDGNSSKRQFALNLQKSKVPPWKTASRKKAADAIKADLKKTKTEKALEGLKKSIDEGKDDTHKQLDAVKDEVHSDGGAKHDDDHGGGDHH